MRKYSTLLNIYHPPLIIKGYILFKYKYSKKIKSQPCKAVELFRVEMDAYTVLSVYPLHLPVVIDSDQLRLQMPAEHLHALYYVGHAQLE
jgi:hypothetical protein